MRAFFLHLHTLTSKGGLVSVNVSASASVSVSVSVWLFGSIR